MGNVVMLAKFLVLPLGLGDFVARKNSHQDTKTQSLTKKKNNKILNLTTLPYGK